MIDFSIHIFKQRVICMKHRFKRLMAGSLALVLSASLTLSAQGVEVTVDQEAQVTPLEVTTGTYTPKIPASYGTVQPGGLYTLIALPSETNPPQNLTAQGLLGYTDNALFIGSAIADAQGELTFQDVRLRTAQAAVYYVTGPGLTTPYREATNTYTNASGTIITASTDSTATITLVDLETDYRYNARTYSQATGTYSIEDLAPGRYKIQVEKPGYLTYLSTKATDYLDVSNGVSVTQNVNITANVGDVDNNGVRNMADLATQLMYYGPVPPQPPGINADLDGNWGQVDDADVALLLRYGTELTTGDALNVADAAISVQDSGDAASPATSPSG